MGTPLVGSLWGTCGRGAVPQCHSGLYLVVVAGAHAARTSLVGVYFTFIIFGVWSYLDRRTRVLSRYARPRGPREVLTLDKF